MRNHTSNLRLFALTFLMLLFSTVLWSQKKIQNRKNKEDLYEAKQYALRYLSDSAVITRFGMIADKIWNFAELGMQEFKSSALLIKTLEDEGFSVEKNVAGIPTCFVGTWGSGKPVIGILGEFDALPGLSQKAHSPVKAPLVDGAPGHGCGHNMMGTAGVAAAISVKKSMEANGISGTVKFFGSPAEETLISRPYMVREGVFRDVDAIIDNHASSGMSTSYGVAGNAVISVVFSFSGKTAHAAGAPWAGISALDAVELMDVATNFLREHLHTTYRLHYVITEGGKAPNVVPDRASVWYYIRNTDERLEENYEKVLNCARGAAIATGATLDSVRVLTAIHQRHYNKGMAEVVQKNIELVGMPEWTPEEELFAKALQKELGVEEKGYSFKIQPLKDPSEQKTEGSSSDVGEVTMVAPTATLSFPGEVPGAIGHHWSIVTCNYGPTAWKGLNAGAKVMAASAIDLLTKPGVLEEIRKEFEAESKAHPYKSFLPEGAKPPLDLNREMMEKYRGQMMEVSQEEN